MPRASATESSPGISNCDFQQSPHPRRYHSLCRKFETVRESVGIRAKNNSPRHSVRKLLNIVLGLLGLTLDLGPSR
ncbi:unnamed protein product [Nezara viridula]|uniref:Uncharacterized protein n=1 Tax=Nezara viridula TaxID=85310 RepID=A0A9P0MMA6_NEZVI|nr:unnamed protein product [Nezara viridula]